MENNKLDEKYFIEAAEKMKEMDINSLIRWRNETYNDRQRMLYESIRRGTKENNTDLENTSKLLELINLELSTRRCDKTDTEKGKGM